MTHVPAAAGTHLPPNPTLVKLGTRKQAPKKRSVLNPEIAIFFLPHYPLLTNCYIPLLRKTIYLYTFKCTGLLLM